MVKAAADVIRHDANLIVPARALVVGMFGVLASVAVAAWTLAGAVAEVRQELRDNRNAIAAMRMELAERDPAQWHVSDMLIWEHRQRAGLASTPPTVPDTAAIVRDRMPAIVAPR